MVPCGYRPLFVRGFLCCLLLGSLAVWVTLGEWSLGSYPFSSPEWLRAPVTFGFLLRQDLTFGKFFPFRIFSLTYFL